MREKRIIVIRSIAGLLVVVAAFRIVATMVTGGFLLAFQAVPVFFAYYWGFHVMAIIAGVGLWFLMPWARWVAVCVLGVAAIATAGTMSVCFHEIFANTPVARHILPPDQHQYFMRVTFWQYAGVVMVALSSAIILLSRSVTPSFKV